MDEKKQIITGFLPEELKQILRKQKQSDYRARQILSWIYKKCVFSFSLMLDLPKELRQVLGEKMAVLGLEPKKKVVSHLDKTAKYVFCTQDGELIESVFIPTAKRKTVCVSTQIGCAFGCIFCASGLHGLKRNLNADEIVSQVLLVKKDVQLAPITNIVVMGMGEPLANYENTLKAVKIFNHPECLGQAARKITISTCGLPKEILQLAKEGMQVELSISLHAADDNLRNKLMPINRKHPLSELIKTAKEYTRLTNRIITFEYVLMAGVNDKEEDAKNLALLLSNLKCKVNLIAFNPVNGLKFSSISKTRLESFNSILKTKRLNFTVRRQRGQDICGACGQLRIKFSQEV